MCEALQGIYDDGKLEGKLEGRLEGIQAMVETFKELGQPMECAKGKIVEKFSLNEEEAMEYITKYWK